MPESKAPTRLAITASDVAPRTRKSGYPEPFASRMGGREKRQLGEVFGLRNFGVNLTTLRPGGQSALLHRHTTQDEFVYIMQGAPTLVTDAGEVELSAGMCAGFPANGIAHQLVNRTDREVIYLEVGDRAPGDQGSYPADDLEANLDADGQWRYTHKNGEAY